MTKNKTNIINDVLEDQDPTLKENQPVSHMISNIYAQINKTVSTETPFIFEKANKKSTSLYFLEKDNLQKIVLNGKGGLIANIDNEAISKTLLLGKVLYISDMSALEKLQYLSIYTSNPSCSCAVFPLNVEKRFLGVCVLVSIKDISVIKNKESQIKKIIAPLKILAENYFLADNIKFLNMELNSNLFSIIELLISLIEIRDHYTSGHSRNVKLVSKLIAKKAGLSPAEISDISYASVLHDVGKINVPEKILNKPYKLNEDEFEEIKKHPLTGALLVANIPKLKKIAKIILHHHERYDGQGYPMGLFRDQIPLYSRIIAVADSFDAIISQRSYRKPMSQKTAIEIISEESGKQFDPEIVDYFLKAIQDPESKLKLVKPFHKIII